MMIIYLTILQLGAFLLPHPNPNLDAIICVLMMLWTLFIIAFLSVVHMSTYSSVSLTGP